VEIGLKLVELVTLLIQDCPQNGEAATIHPADCDASRGINNHVMRNVVLIDVSGS
jgi:hypothetical protein